MVETNFNRLQHFLRIETISVDSMAAEREQNLEKFKKEDHSAFVIGYTGETGKALVKELDQVKAFKRVVLVGRRQTNITEKLGAGFVRHFDKILHSTF